MLIDILSTNNNVCFNSKIAKLVGLKAAIYVAEILNIYDKATRKNVLSEDRYCTIDRDYVETRTTLTTEEQLEAEDVLKTSNILETAADGSVYLNVNTILNLLASFTAPVPVVHKKKKSPLVRTKREAAFDALKEEICTENEELKQAYEDWIDAVCANPKGFLSRKAVKIFQENVERFANHNLDIALKVIDLATVGGYRDATWAIDLYKKQFGVSYRLPETSSLTTEAQLSEVVF